MKAIRVLVTGLVLLSACASGPPAPATLDTKNEACTHCRMSVSDKRFAAQIVAPGEEPRFFDDIGCLRAYLSRSPGLGRGSIAYVADYRNGEWIAAAGAAYLEDERIDTPMASGVIAFADAAARDDALRARGGAAKSAADVFGQTPDGSR